MQKKLHIKKGDTVVVITGNNKGQKGRVLEVITKTSRAIVEGVNLMKKHTKPNPQLGVTGGIVEQEAAIELSNIAIWNPKKKKADRISFLIENDKKVRVYSSDKSEIKS